jgi:hypothetical protein
MAWVGGDRTLGRGDRVDDELQRVLGDEPVDDALLVLPR